MCRSKNRYGKYIECTQVTKICARLLKTGQAEVRNQHETVDASFRRLQTMAIIHVPAHQRFTMKHIALVLIATVVPCLAQDKAAESVTKPVEKLPQNVDLKQMAKDGWTIMFDGKTMKGWKANEEPESWKVVDGTLRCQGKRSHLFYVGKDGKAEFKNFEFRAQVKTQKNANAGIYFHTKYQPEGWPKYGYECQVNISQGDPKKTSSLYAVKNVSAEQLKGLIKDDQWYWQTIIVKDNKITLKVNGKTMVEYEEEKDRKAFSNDFERRLGKGTFALQAHDPGSIVQFRNLMVKPLK